jgi:hypothetical protein
MALTFTSAVSSIVYDTQCLHAQTADYLSRGGSSLATTSINISDGTTANENSSISNIIGATVLDDLRSRGVEVGGCSECWQQVQYASSTTCLVLCLCHNASVAYAYVMWTVHLCCLACSVM